MAATAKTEILLRELIEEQQKTNKLLATIIIEVSKEDIRNEMQISFPGITPFLLEILKEFTEEE
ncbi:hypothetical protein ES703_66171 [subsurface metagenome]